MRSRYLMPPLVTIFMVTLQLEESLGFMEDNSNEDSNEFPEAASNVTLFQSSPSNCNGTWTFSEPEQSYVFQSPNYPNEYPNNYKSSMCFTSPRGTTINVYCDPFNVEDDKKGCYQDYVGVGLTGDPNNIGRYCGSNPVQSPWSNGNNLAIVFRSDSSNSKSHTPHRFSCKIKVSSDNCNCGKRNFRGNSRIISGSEAEPHEFPWRCYFESKKWRIYCGCTIISSRWVMSTVHCSKDLWPPPEGDLLLVAVGDHNLKQSTGRRYLVDKVINHPKYDPDKWYDSDIALFRTNEPIQFSKKVAPACLPFKYSREEFQGATVTASGWGATSYNGSQSSVLKKVDMPIWTSYQCYQHFRRKGWNVTPKTFENIICTYEEGKATCNGDSGSGIDYLEKGGRSYVVGIMSWTVDCGTQKDPDAYTKVTKFLGWIQDNTGDTFCRI